MRIPDYQPIDVSKGKVNISPSGLYTYFNNSGLWYRRNILKTDRLKPNTNLVFGSIVHSLFEAEYQNQEVSIADVDDYLERGNYGDTVDSWYINNNFEEAKEVVKEFLKDRPKPDKFEEQVLFEPISGYTIGGTFDGIYGSTIFDIKTTTSNSSSMKLHHKYQMMCYVFALEANGYEKFETIEIIQFVKGDSVGKISEKTGKIIGVKKPTISVLIEPITDELRQEVKMYLKELITLLKATDEIDYKLLFRDNPLDFMSN